MVDLARAEAQLLLHEGCVLHLYMDTEENWTLGVGYNVSARGLDEFGRLIKRRLNWLEGVDIITRDEALTVLRADITRVQSAVRAHFPFFDQLNEPRQRVVVDMAFNMGFTALGFKKARAAIERQDWSAAARELWNSKWARQVGDGPGGRFDRCDRLSKMLLTGADYVR